MTFAEAINQARKGYPCYRMRDEKTKIFVFFDIREGHNILIAANGKTGCCTSLRDTDVDADDWLHWLRFR